jgi:Tfp pilus assembly protein PilF
MALTVVPILLTVALQVVQPDRRHAEDLARTGRTAEAVELFRQIVESDPADIEARLWVARLDLRLGRTAEAEAEFRSVLTQRPSDVDARIGLGAALTRRGATSEALSVLLETAPFAGDNADFFAALARAYRRAGDDARALEHFARARALAPADGDTIAGYEATALAHADQVAFTGFVEHNEAARNGGSGSLVLGIRAGPRLRLHAGGRVQSRSDATDAQTGAGFLWRTTSTTTFAVRALAGPDNVSLATGDVSADVMHYAGSFEVGGGLRWLSFDGVGVAAGSSVLGWDRGERWRFDGRYTFSRSRFDSTGETAGDHSVLVRGTWRGWRRVWVHAAYAYGIESFEQLTADRLASLGTRTVATGLRIGTPSLTVITTTWEHQWRSDARVVDRVTLAIVQAFL